jgi:hypothetical protein
LKFNLEEVQRVHTQYGDGACTNSCYGMVLADKRELVNCEYRKKGMPQT